MAAKEVLHPPTQKPPMIRDEAVAAEGAVAAAMDAVNGVAGHHVDELGVAEVVAMAVEVPKRGVMDEKREDEELREEEGRQYWEEEGWRRDVAARAAVGWWRREEVEKEERDQVPV